jgi:hypothetical protein
MDNEFHLNPVVLCRFPSAPQWMKGRASEALVDHRQGLLSVTDCKSPELRRQLMPLNHVEVFHLKFEHSVHRYLLRLLSVVLHHEHENSTFVAEMVHECPFDGPDVMSGE